MKYTTKNHMQKNSLLFEIFVLVVGLFIMLFGMRLISMVSMKVTASYLNIIPLLISLWFIVKNLHLERLVGKRAITLFFVFIVVLCLLSILFSSIFVYNNYLDGAGELCAHPEHVWFYDNLLTISRFTSADWQQGALADLYLEKYQNMAVYGSLYVRFGGDVPTNMCIWSAFNLSLVAFLMVLSAVRLGIDDKKGLSVIMLLCLLQPYLDMIFANHRDGYGMVAIALGFYVFITTYKNPAKNIIAYPFYALLLWSFRAQYLIIASILLFWGLILGNRKTLNIVSGVLVVALLILFVQNTNMVDYAYSNMHLEGYEESATRQGRSLFNSLLISILGYFPWLNLSRDPLWPWQLFAVFQGAMNVTIIYHIFTSYKNSFQSFINKPELLTGLLLIAASVFVPGHMSYTVVAMPFLAISLSKVNQKTIFKTYFVSILIVFFGGIIYSLLGLTGTRAFT